MVCEPGLASFGTSTRSCRLVLSLMPGIAAATGWPPPRTSAFQPAGTPSHRQRQRLGREARVLQLEADVGDLARPHGLRRDSRSAATGPYGGRPPADRRRDARAVSDDESEQSDQTAHFRSLRLIENIPVFTGAKVLP